MGYKQKLGSKEKNTPTNFNEKDAKRVSESFNFGPSNMEVEITATEKTVPRGYSAPSGDSKTGRKVNEIKKERTFSDVALSPKEKMGKKGAKWAKTRKFSVQNVSFNNKK
jgi:hypothetical protein